MPHPGAPIRGKGATRPGVISQKRVLGTTPRMTSPWIWLPDLRCFLLVLASSIVVLDEVTTWILLSTSSLVMLLVLKRWIGQVRGGIRDLQNSAAGGVKPVLSLNLMKCCIVIPRLGFKFFFWNPGTRCYQPPMADASLLGIPGVARFQISLGRGRLPGYPAIPPVNNK